METKHFKNKAELNKIDFENGQVFEVSLVSTGEVLGHNMWLNEQGIDSFLKCVEGTQVKAYYKHSDENEALSSIGFFENFSKKKTEKGEYKIIGDFCALNAWKDSNEKEYKTFFELADKAPEVFGISLEGLISSGYYNDKEELVMVEDEMPDEQTKIYAFCEKILALSVVSTPATNPNGLFSQDTEELEEETETEETEECPMEERINKLEKELNTIMDLAKELRDEKESLVDDNEELTAQVEGLESKVASLEIGSDPVEHNFSDEPLDISSQIQEEKDWAKKYKLVMGNLNNFQLEREGSR